MSIDYRSKTTRAALKQRLVDDPTLSAILTGGVFNADDFSFDLGGADEIPRDTDGVTVLPFAIMRWNDSPLYGPITIGAESSDLEIYVYDDRGFQTITQAIGRIKTLLGRTSYLVSDADLCSVDFSHISGEMSADEFGGIPFRFIRFESIIIRSE